MNSKTIIVSDATLKKMGTFYQDHLTPHNNQYVLFTARIPDCVITAYKSKKVLFQGKNAVYEASIWEENDPSTFYLESIGSDEVGTGDYFGPVVVVSCFLDASKIALLKSERITDSKVISDPVIRKTAPLLFAELPYSLLVVHNEKYNELMSEEEMNLDKLKALLHKQAISNLLSKINKQPQIILDQFTTPEFFQKYTKDPHLTNQITFRTKAESQFASVACASIMARYIFLQEMDKLSKTVKTPLQKGAGKTVDEQGVMLVRQYGQSILQKIAKYHFKNTEKILNNLKMR